MRTDLKVGVICLFALVLASVGFFAYHSNKAPKQTTATPSHPADTHALSVASPADAPTTAPSAAPAPAPALSFASGLGPSHALGADTPTILPPSPTTAPASTPLIPPGGPTSLTPPGSLNSPGGLSAPLNQPLVPSGSSSGLVPPGGSNLGNGTPSLLPPSTVPGGASGGIGSLPASGTSGFSAPGASHSTSLEVGSGSSRSSAVEIPSFGSSSTSHLSSDAAGGEYAIQKGDTIAALAKKNHTTTKAILAANPGINPNRLKVGQKIKIPESNGSSSSTLGGMSLPTSTFDLGTPGETTTKPATTGRKSKTSPRSTRGAKTAAPQSHLAGGTYTIKKGDTLRKIAKTVYGNEALWRRIFRANRGDLSSPNAIKVGQVIRLPK
ncbi:MAG: LysM peptidoglycan-binding domain-containing protein [Phycisphaerae bacterium]